MWTDALVFLGFDSDAFDSTVLLGRLNNGITNDDIGIDIRESILDFAHCCSSSFVFYCL